MKAEGHSADTGARKFPLVSMGGRADGLACADPGARTPIGTGRNFDPTRRNMQKKMGLPDPNLDNPGS